MRQPGGYHKDQRSLKIEVGVDRAKGVERRLRIESQFNAFVGFASRGFPLPPAQRVLGSINQHRMPALHFDQFNRAIGRNRDVCPDDTLKVHGAGQAGILRNHFVHNFAHAFGRFLGRKRLGASIRIDTKTNKATAIRFMSIAGTQDKRNVMGGEDYPGNAARVR